MRITVANTKGGTGKTTTSVHLAALLGRRGCTVLIDADPQGSATRWAQLAGAEMPFRTVSSPAPDLDRRLPLFAQDAEHVVIDTPPGHEDIVRGAPGPPGPHDRLMAVAALGGGRGGDPRRARRRPTTLTSHVLLTRVRSGTRSVRSARALLTSRGLPVLETEIPMMEAYGWGYGMVPPEGHRYGQLLDELLPVAVV